MDSTSTRPRRNAIDSWIEQQLHQEFSENYNSISSYVLAFAGSLIVGFSAFGYCTKLLLADAANNFLGCLLLLTLSYFGCLGICCATAFLSIKQGWSMRRDQFIIHAIRFRHLGKDAWSTPFGRFPSEYHPFHKLKTKNSSDILVGTFQYLFQISKFSSWCLSIITVIVITISCLLREEYACKTFIAAGFSIIFVAIAYFGFYYFSTKWLNNIKYKYIYLENEMKSYAPSSIY